MRSRHIIAGLVLAATVAQATPLFASSDDAWKEFQTNVQKGCAAAVGDRLVKPTFIVEPHGTETYGVAVARGRSKYGKAQRMIVCVFDKKTKTTESTDEMPR